MPTSPISKPRASKLVERLKDGPPRLDARWFIKGPRALVELAEDAAPLGAEFVPAQPLVLRLAQVLGAGPPTRRNRPQRGEATGGAELADLRAIRDGRQ